MQISRTRRETPDTVRGEATFRSRGRGRPGGTRTRTGEGVARWASRRACGTWATPPMAGTALGGGGVGQEPLRPLLRGREAPRLDAPLSIGSVPLQSG